MNRSKLIRIHTIKGLKLTLRTSDSRFLDLFLKPAWYLH